MSRIKEPFDLYSIADVVEKNYEFCHSATRVFVSLFSFFLSFFFFFTFLDSRDRLDRRTAYVEDLMDLLPFVYLIIFSLSRFSLFFSEDDTIF